MFAAARAIYYPFWAAGASRDELDRSWGGPGALGATVAHWAVAAATIAVMYAVIVLMERLATSRRGAGTAVGSGLYGRVDGDHDGSRRAPGSEVPQSF